MCFIIIWTVFFKIFELTCEDKIWSVISDVKKITFVLPVLLLSFASVFNSLPYYSEAFAISCRETEFPCCTWLRNTIRRMGWLSGVQQSDYGTEFQVQQDEKKNHNRVHSRANWLYKYESRPWNIVGCSVMTLTAFTHVTYPTTKSREASKLREIGC